MASPFDNNPQLQYDLREAQKAGLTEKDIARYASQRRNYDYDAARQAGLDDADIIRYNIANVSAVGGPVAFVQEAVPALVTAPAIGYGMAKGFGAGLKVPGPPPVKFGAGILGALIGAAIPGGIGAAATEEIKERTGLDGQYVPSAQPGAVAGETFGFVSGFGLPMIAKGVASKVAGTKLGDALGLKSVGPAVAQSGDDVFLQAGVREVDLGSAVFADAATNNPAMKKAYQRASKILEGLEKPLTSSRGRRLEAPVRSLATDIGIAGGASLGAAGAEALAPDDMLMRVGGEIAGGMFNLASLANVIGGSFRNLLKRGFDKVKPGYDADEGRVVKSLQRMVDDMDAESVRQATIDGKLDQNLLDKIRLNVDDVIESLEAEDPAIFGALGKPPKLNAAEKSNSEFMRLIGATLLSMRSKGSGGDTGFLRAGVIAQSQKAAEDMGAILDSLAVIETPEMMSVVSRLKEDNAKTLMEGVLNAHTLKAIDNANLIGERAKDRRATLAVRGTDPKDVSFTPGGALIGSPTEAAKTLINTIMRASDESRKIENGLWKQVDKKIEVPINNLIRFWDKETNPEFGGMAANESLYIPFIKQWINERKAPLEEALAPLRKERERLQQEIKKASDNLQGAKKRLAAKPDEIYTQRQVARYEQILKEGGYPVRGGETGRQRLNTVQAEIDKLERGAKATMGQLQDFRSQMLKNQRVTSATSAGAPQAGFYSQLAEKALDDMAPKDNPNLNLTGTQRIKYDNARAFSRAFNDVFTRAYGGELLRTQATGADRLTPEQLANRLITSAGNETAARFTQLNNAMDFIIQKQPDPTLKAEMRALKKYDLQGATEIILRDILSKKVVDPLTNEIRQRPLAKVLQEYEEVFAVPGLNRLGLDLRDANKSALILNKVREDISTAGYKIPAGRPAGEMTIKPKGLTPKRTGEFEIPLFKNRLENIDAVRTFLNNRENPGAEIITIRSSNNPAEAMEGLINLVKRSNRNVKGNAVEGLRQVVMDAAVESSKRTDGTVDFVKFNNFLNEPMKGRNSLSLREILKNGKIISDDEFNDLATLAEAGRRTERIIEGADAPDQLIADILQSGSMLGAAAGRAAGASLFSSSIQKVYDLIGLQGLRSAALVEAQLGASLAGKYLDQLPYQAQERILFESFKDPEKMAALMRKIRKPSDVRRFHKMQRPLLESLIGLEGYREISERIGNDAFFEEETVQEMPVAAPAAPAPTPPPQAAAAPLVQPTPAPMAPAPASRPPVQPAQAPASPNTRSQYAALFPYDTASELIRGQEGIASLMT